MRGRLQSKKGVDFHISPLKGISREIESVPSFLSGYHIEKDYYFAAAKNEMIESRITECEPSIQNPALRGII